MKTKGLPRKGSMNVVRLRRGAVQQVTTAELQQGDVICKYEGSDTFGRYWVLEAELRQEFNPIGCGGRHFGTNTPSACYPWNSTWWIKK